MHILKHLGCSSKYPIMYIIHNSLRVARKQDSKHSVNFGPSHQDSNQKSRKLRSLPLPLPIGPVNSFSLRILGSSP